MRIGSMLKSKERGAKRAKPTSSQTSLEDDGANFGRRREKPDTHHKHTAPTGAAGGSYRIPRTMSPPLPE